MKRCPECGREYDNSMMFCLDDGTELLYGPAAMDDPGPAMLHSTADPSEAPTRAQIHTTNQTEVLSPDDRGEMPTPRVFDKRLVGFPIVLAVLLLGGFVGYRYFNYANSKEIGSIAVLPFQNVSGDPNVEYVSDGLAEALINSLTELQQLKVIARSTAFRYKGREIDPKQVGNELGVRSVLTGRVKQLGNSLNVQVDLVDAETGTQLWGKEYQRQASDVLEVKQAIAREVSSNLRLRLSGEQQQQLIRRDTENAEAYQFYLRGRHFWNKRTAEGIRRAMVEFQQAIDRDPNFALGYVGLADCYWMLEEYAGVPARETLPKARAAADRALQINDALAEAHASSAVIYKRQWRWADAEQGYKRAISLNPNYASAHHWFAIYLYTKGQFDDAMREIKRAQELDPLSPVISANVAIVYILENDLGSAVEECRRIIELDLRHPAGRAQLGWAYYKQRRYEEAAAELEKAVELSGRATNNLSFLGYFYGATGKRAEALRILNELEDKYTRREAIGQDLAGVHAGLGDKDQAFAWLEKGFEDRSGQLPYITTHFIFDDLRSDERYADLVRRIGL